MSRKPGQNGNALIYFEASTGRGNLHVGRIANVKFRYKVFEERV
ncbi:hypothetical protein [Algoriphagus resistens]|nr:hypothetical protein [Algoriphagus resistens]